jgi:putative heme transporter
VPVVAVINTVTLYLHGHDKFPQLGLDDHVAVRGRGHPALDQSIAQVATETRASLTPKRPPTPAETDPGPTVSET